MGRETPRIIIFCFHLFNIFYNSIKMRYWNSAACLATMILTN